MSDLEALRSAMTKALEGLEGPDFYVPGNAIPYLVSAVFPVVESFLSSRSGPQPKELDNEKDLGAESQVQWRALRSDGTEIGTYLTELRARSWRELDDSVTIVRRIVRYGPWEVAP